MSKIIRLYGTWYIGLSKCPRCLSVFGGLRVCEIVARWLFVFSATKTFTLLHRVQKKVSSSKKRLDI